MALEGLLALLTGGISGYGQGRRDYLARPKTDPEPPLTNGHPVKIEMRPAYKGPVPGRYQPLPPLPMASAPKVPLTPRTLPPLPMASAPKVPLTPRTLPPLRPIEAQPPRLIRR